MSWQKKRKRETRWKNVSRDVVQRVLETNYHHPKQVLSEMENSPGRVVKTMFSVVRYVESRR